MATVTGSKRHLDITSETLTTSSNVDVGAKLFITTTDTNTTSTSALVLNGDEVETRTLGSNAFNSTSFLTSETFSSSDVAFSLAGNDIIAGTSITLGGGLSYNSATNTLSQADNNTTYSAGSLLDLSSTTFNVDLTELSNNTSTFAPTQDHFVILDNGVQGKKLASSIFGSAAYEASSAFATASHNHAGVYVPEYENLAQASGAEHDMHQWRKVHASYSNNSGNSTYLIIQTEVPQDSYSMGGFTLVYQDDYSSGGEGGEIKIYGYWNPESNGGFNGFRYECSNPYHTPTIEVCRNSSSGKTAFFISGEGGNYAQLIAKDMWLGYNASSATAQWGSGWVISEAGSKDGYTNFNTLNRNDFAAITTNGSTPSLTGGVSASEVRTLIGAQVSGSYLTAHPSITQAANVDNSGGTVIQDLTFDSNGHVTATGSVNLDNIYTSTDGTENDYRFTLNLGNFTGTRWYRVGTVNTGSGGMRIRGMLTNHVESFGSCMVDLSIQGREGNANNEIEITGHVHSLNENSGIAVFQSETASGSYQNWDVYVVATKYTQCQLDLTKVSCSFDTSGTNVTNEPEGTKELDTSTLAEGNYVIRNSIAYKVFDSGINLSGGLSYTASTNTLSQTDNNTTYNVATTSANGLLSSTDKTKLDGIETSADVTDATNVSAAGALMKSGGTMTGTLAGNGTNLITGFVAPQNPEGSHIKAPWFFNDLAYARLKGATVSVTVTGGSAASNGTIDAMLDASTGYGSFSTDGVTSVVIEISNLPKNFTYGTHLGVTFGNTTWRARDVQLESYYSGQWNTILDVSNQPNEYVVKSYNSSSNSQTKLRWTFSNFNAGTMRIVSLFCYNYNATGMPSLFMPLNGGAMYGSLTMNTGNINLSGNKIYADTSSPTAHIQVGAGTTNTGNRSDVALLGAGNSGGVVNALGLVNTAAGANGNGVALNFHNGNAWSPTGQIIVKQNSSGTSTDSGMYFYTYDGGLNNRMTIKSDGNIRLHAYSAGLLKTDANGNVSVDTSSYLTSIGSNSVGIAELNVSDGSNGQVLTTDGNGSLSFTTVTSGSSYTLPAATDDALGGVKLGYTEANKNYAVQLDSESKAFVNVPWANTNTTYSAGSGLSLSGTTFSVDEFAADKHIYTTNEHGTANKGVFMPMVKGGFYATSTSTITGRLKVVLPSYRTNMMVSFKLDIYEYNTDRTVSYQISGYNNNDANATWYNTSVVCLSDSDNRNLTVRFLRDLDAGEQYIGIGEVNTTWSYPQVIVRDFMGGYNTQIQKASGSWSVGFVQDDPGVVVNTHSNNTPIVLTSRLSGTISTSQLADNSVNATKLNVSGNGTSGQVLTSDGDGTFSWTAKTTNTNTVTSVGVSGSETTGTVTIAATGAASVSQSGSTITIDATDTNTNTTYSAGSGLDLTSTTFSVEPDLRDGITHVGKDTSNYIQFDSTNGRIDFYAGGTFVARLESDGDLHIKGDVIAFSNIFS